MIQIRCALCDSYNDYAVIYKKNFFDKDLNKDVFSARRLPDGSHYQIVRCNKDGLVRSNPILELSKINKLYKDSKFTYEKEIGNLETTYLKALKPVLDKLLKSDNILEIGCGNGFMLSNLLKIGYKNCYGCEPSAEAVNKADEDIRNNLVIDILKPKIFKSKKFKFIFFFQTLDHIPDPGKFLKECYNLLEKGGFILAFNHNIESLSSKLFGEKSPIIDIEHTFLYSPKTIRALFKKYQFTPLRIYSPVSTISLKHFFGLLPLPQAIKKNLYSNAYIPNLNLRLRLGNLCIIAKK